VSHACILGCAGPKLSASERAFFREVKPWGFILFKRNLETPDQVKKLVDSLRRVVDHDQAPVLIDQEGGRVQRLGPPNWPKYPPGRAYGAAFKDDPQLRREMTRLGARLMAHDLAKLGINVDCVPVLDVPQPGANDVIGDRAYANDPDEVAVLGRAAAEGLLAGGVLPVMKHMPGHGRSLVDTHLALPVVDAPLKTLRAVDFKPFQVCSDLPMGMTSHIVFKAIDSKNPVTLSKKAIGVIRDEIGFDGLLMSDDISMKALGGGFAARARSAIRAGLDIVLHCNGDMDEMKGVVSGTGKLKGDAKRRAGAALARLAHTPEPFDEAQARARFKEAFGA
jgi:beta-N-acetylhexosaminidase